MYGRHTHDVGRVASACHFGRFGFESPALIVGFDRPLESDLPILRDHFHVMRITGQALVFHGGLPYPPAEATIPTVVLLLIGRNAPGARSRVFAFVLSAAGCAAAGSATMV